MTAYTELLKAIAALLWPVFAFTALFMFRHEASILFKRLRKGKILGSEFELGPGLDRLEVAATATVAELAAPPPEAPSVPKDPALEALNDDTVRRVLELAATSPKASLLFLASELERALTQLLASLGELQGRDFVPFREGMSLLLSHAGLPSSLMASVDLFYRLRNRLVHGKGVTDDDVLRAIDSGISIYRAVASVPHEVHRVLHTDVPLFRDAACNTPLEGARGVIFESRGSDGNLHRIHIFPTTRTHFQKGQQVAWEWFLSRHYPECWYRDPETDGIKHAWSVSVEFVGRNTDQL